MSRVPQLPTPAAYSSEPGVPVSRVSPFGTMYSTDLGMSVSHTPPAYSSGFGLPVSPTGYGTPGTYSHQNVSVKQLVRRFDRGQHDNTTSQCQFFNLAKAEETQTDISY